MKNKPKSPQRIIETKPFIKKYNWEEYIIHQKKMTGKSLRNSI